VRDLAGCAVVRGGRRDGQKGNKNAGRDKETNSPILGNSNCQNSDNSFSQNSANPPSPTDRKKVAAAQAGIGHDTYAKAKGSGKAATEEENSPTLGNFLLASVWNRTEVKPHLHDKPPSKQVSVNAIRKQIRRILRICFPLPIEVVINTRVKGEDPQNSANLSSPTDRRGAAAATCQTTLVPS